MNFSSLKYCPADPPTSFSGRATYYTLCCTFGCSYASQAIGQYYCAASSVGANNLWSSSGSCGACIQASYAAGGTSVIVQVVDSCPTCAGPNDLDLSQTAFSALGNISLGNIAITWHFIECPLSILNANAASGGNVTYFYKDGETSGIFFEDYLFPIVSVVTGKGESLTHSVDNRWQSASGYFGYSANAVMPVTITDARGNKITANVTLTNGTGSCAGALNPCYTSVTGGGAYATTGLQFPGCVAAPTATPTNTATRTPTGTPTRTATITPTFTLTATRTSTPTASPTGTPTHTATATLSSTPSPTATSTATRTSTSTPSATASRTPTSTVTPTGTNSATSTPTRTASSTPSNTATATMGNTSTSTPTRTPTSTATASPSSTPTRTATGTSTSSPTATSSSTPTATGALTSTPTTTPSSTPTSTATRTITSTASSTVSSTATPTASATSTLGNTATSTATGTSTFSSTPTSSTTSTATASRTSTASATATASATGTSSFTPSATPSFTSTPSSTPSSTRTSTLTPTRTATSTFTVTNTPRPDSTPIVHPNPATGDQVTVIPPGFSSANDLKIEVFTTAFRKVHEEDHPNPLPGIGIALELKDKTGVRLADGIYYVVVSLDGRRTVTKLLILR